MEGACEGWGRKKRKDCYNGERERAELHDVGIVGKLLNDHGGRVAL
jgi:hypothetical protein